MDEILPNLGMELPDIGSDQDTWGDILNENLRILDNAVTYDAITKTLGAVDVTLTTAEAAHGVINLDGTLTANVNLIVPVSPVRLYLVNNGTTGAFTVTVKTPLGTGVVVNQSANTLVYSDGTNIVQGATSVNGSFAAGTANVGTLNVSGNATVTGALSSGATTFITTGNKIAVFGTGSVFSANPASTGALDNVTVGATTPSTGAFTTLSASGTTTLATASATNLSYTGTLTGGTGVVNIGSGQIYKSAIGDLGLGTASPTVTGSYTVLDMVGRSATNGGMLITRTSDSAGVGRLYTSNTQVLLDDSASTSDIFIKTNGANNVLIGTANTERFRIDSVGNVGVGVSNPFTRFVVATEALSATFSRIGDNGSGSESAFQITNVGSGGGSILGCSGASLQFRAGPVGTAAASQPERARITSAGNQIDYQPAESAQNASVTLSVANLQAQIITSNAAVTLTLPTGTTLEGYTTSMATNTAFEVTFIATTANAITIGANGNTTVGSLTVAGNTSGTFRFRKTATNTFTVYRVA